MPRVLGQDRGVSRVPWEYHCGADVINQGQGLHSSLALLATRESLGRPADDRSLAGKHICLLLVKILYEKKFYPRFAS